MTPDGFDDTGAQFAPELVDHAGDPCPAGIKGVRRNSFIDLAGGEHLPWPAGQQEQNIKLHRPICREPKSSGASAEAATVDKSATEARADIALLKRAFSSSLNDRIINFPSNSPPNT